MGAAFTAAVFGGSDTPAPPTATPPLSTVVRVHNLDPAPQIVVPSRAVVEQMGEYFVFVIQNDHALQHKVTLGTRIGDKIVVRRGLQAGEKVVTNGVQKLRDSSVVAIGAPKAPAAAPAGK